MDCGISPQLGLVFPFNKTVQAFSDALLEMNFMNYWKGLLTDYITPGFDAGLTFVFPDVISISPKYRGIWYKDCYTHTVGISCGFRF